MNGESIINEQFKKFVPIIQNYCNMTTFSIFMSSADHMAIFLPACSHPLAANIATIAAVTPAMTELRIRAYLQTPSPQTDLQHHIRHMKQNETIGLKIIYLQELPTLTCLPSRHMQPGILRIIYLTMAPQMLSESMLLINAKIFASSTLVLIVLTLTTTPGLKIPTRFRSHLRTQKFISGTVHASMQTIVGNLPILICPDMTDNVLSQGWSAKNKSDNIQQHQ